MLANSNLFVYVSYAKTNSHNYVTLVDISGDKSLDPLDNIPPTY